MASQSRPDYPFAPVPFTSVHLNDSFWAPRIEINRTASIPSAFEQCERTQRVYHFERAAQVLAGEKLEDTRPPGYPFDDTDLYKVIEGAAYALSVSPDPKLDAYADSLIAKIAAAQEPDGYLYTARTMKPNPPHRWVGTERWQLERDDSHELYNSGHLIEAAVAHKMATGKDNLLRVATKNADLLVRTFGRGKRSTWPGHQITEMALVRLYRLTNRKEYLDLAEFLIDERGPGPDPAKPLQFPNGERANPRGLEYNQAHKRVAEQDEPVGHAVRAMYMYAGMADIAALKNDPSLRLASLRLWDNLLASKMYLTGGIGAAGGHEGFGAPYDLPNATAYNETCASVGMDYWNHRLFLLEGDAKYIDVMERTLFNGLLSGVSLDGKTFFYPNVLESNGRHARSPWFGVACCPGNITRFMASVPGYLYATRGDAIYVNLFAAGTADIATPGGRLQIVQATRYPWDGAVRITINPEKSGRRFAMNVRIPGWSRNEAVPSDLYRFVDAAPPPARLAVNGSVMPLSLANGYATIDRSWATGDVIDLMLPMPARRVIAHPNVEADRGRVAIQRGPIVYAAEWADNPGGKVRSLVLPDAGPLSVEFRPGLLNGVSVVTTRGVALRLDAKDKVVRTEQPITLIPYATWANRGRGEMAVWLPRTEAVGRPAPFPTLAMSSRISASRENGQGWLPAIIEGDEPASSRSSVSMFNWWPLQGWGPGCEPSADTARRRTPQCSQGEWIQIDFPKASTVSAAEVYWFDDAPGGGVRVPAGWKLLYRDGEQWKPVDAQGEYGIEKDAWNRVTFTPVTTTALRLEIVLQPGQSAGVQEWRVR